MNRAKLLIDKLDLGEHLKTAEDLLIAELARQQQLPHNPARNPGEDALNTANIIDIDTAQRVKRIIAEQLGLVVDDIKPDDTLESTLGADDLDMIEIAMSIEDEFAIEFEFPDIFGGGTVTVASTIELVKGKL